MKKMNNKGFSLVELIIVIAIMAILAGAIAPALIRYIDKSRKSNDVSAAKSIKTAVETAMTNENAYEALTTATGGSVNDVDGNTIAYSGKVVVTANGTAIGTTGTGVSVDATGAPILTTVTDAATDAQIEIGKNIGEKTPKIKYKKAAKDGGAVPDQWVAYISTGGSVIVGLEKNGTAGSFYQLAPEVCEYYQ